MIAACGAAGLVGCAGGANPGTSSGTNVGTLQVALLGTAPSGSSYRLDNAVFNITNFDVFPATNLTLSGDTPTVSVDLPPSTFPFDYEIVLEDGWTLSSVNADGSEQPLGATVLASAISFTIKPQRTTPITFQFKASEQIVTMGNGTAAVGVAVDDTLIDDFEDGDGQLAPLGGRNGSWFTFNDGTGTETPAPGGPALPKVVDTSANFLLDVIATGFAPEQTLPNGTSAFGAAVGANLLINTAGQPLPYNASKYSGIDFSLSATSASPEPVQISFLVATSATTPVAQGGTCTGICSDDFGVVTTFFGNEFPGEFFPFGPGFSWSQLQQQGFGTPATFDPATILTLKWIVSFPNEGQTASADAVELQLDNVSFTESPFPIGGGASGAGGAAGGAGNADGGIAPPSGDGGEPILPDGGPEGSR